MFKRILVPLDGSGFAETALPIALTIRRKAKAHMELISIHEPLPTFSYDTWENAAQSWSEDYLAELTRKMDASARNLDFTVRKGHVVEELIRRVEDSHVELVVMATHGRGPLTRAWLGSVADSFVRHAPCPVLLVRPDPDEQGSLDEDVPLRKILVPLDGSKLSESILGPACELAEMAEAQLILHRAVTYPLEIASSYLPHTVQLNQQIVDEAKEGASHYLQGLTDQLAEKGIDVVADLRVDTQAGHSIVKAAEEREADLIMMSTHARGGLARAVIGSATDKVIRAAHMPVLVYPPAEE